MGIEAKGKRSNLLKGPPSKAPQRRRLRGRDGDVRLRGTPERASVTARRGHGQSRRDLDSDAPEDIQRGLGPIVLQVILVQDPQRVDLELVEVALPAVVALSDFADEAADPVVVERDPSCSRRGAVLRA
jgi:hypothetical protein